MTRSSVTLDELASMVGTSFRSGPLIIDVKETRAFEDLTKVTDVYRDVIAKDIPDGMVEGFHTLSMLDYLIHSYLRPDPESCYGLNYGFERIRFPKNHISGEALHLDFTIVSAAPRDEGLLVTYKCSLATINAAKPVLVADWLCLYLPRKTTGFKPDNPAASAGASHGEVAR